MATIHIQSGKNAINSNLKNTKIHSVPFKVHADVDAPVSKCFEPYITSDENGAMSASFRGYPLNGTKIPLPDGYVGVVLHESIKPQTEKDERKVYVINNFNEVIYWNWDKLSSKNDAFVQALDWIEIAEALHSPIKEE